ncbi:MAG: Rha family transcriptional regulator [Sphingobium sp.]|nr:Rha family transcriptional regulator [Sphingobium sp.]MBP6112586.1 Rha family transcriptional regulator [Sphingobium sp.]MBP8671620.1 Rha family transcriptional regulator [Sphingobium sp.]MBP9158616.1 Rha family transcriptional regulator [Sphingobium sp.]
MNALVEIRDGAARANSLVVADKFGKQHKDVLRAVTVLAKSRPDLERNFAPMIRQVEIGKGGSRASRYFEMDRKGFMLLVMGFTGEKALDWKIRFIDAFDRMEALLSVPQNDDDEEGFALAASPAPPDLPFVERMKVEPPTIQLAYVREMRLARGRPGAIRAMVALGWEEEEETGAGALTAMLPRYDPDLEGLARWLDERTVRSPGERIRTAALWQDWRHWCAQQGFDARNDCWFGKSLPRLGVARRKSGVSICVGVHLKN